MTRTSKVIYEEDLKKAQDELEGRVKKYIKETIKETVKESEERLMAYLNKVDTGLQTVLMDHMMRQTQLLEKMQANQVLILAEQAKHSESIAHINMKV